MYNKNISIPLIGEMRQFPLFFMFIFCAFVVRAQEIDHHMEFGVMGGVMNYTGDLNNGANLRFKGPAFGAFYRNNYPNQITVLRVNLLAGQISGNEKTSGNPLPEELERGFSTAITEVSTVLEYNFFDYRSMTGIDYRICPYLFGGLGLGVLWSGDSPTFITIPLGAGVKFKVGDRVNMGVEIGARKSFTDQIDGVGNDDDVNSSSNNDWYYFTGLTFSYTRYYQKCPKNTPKN